jgi:hypothetical protein
MAESYRRHALIEAPIEDVWPIVSDPRTHPDWWPDVIEVRTSGEPTEGDEYSRVSRRLGFLDVRWLREALDALPRVVLARTKSAPKESASRSDESPDKW